MQQSWRRTGAAQDAQLIAELISTDLCGHDSHVHVHSIREAVKGAKDYDVRGLHRAGTCLVGKLLGARGSAHMRPAAGGWPWRFLSGPGKFWMPGGQPVAGIGTQAVELVSLNVVWSAWK